MCSVEESEERFERFAPKRCEWRERHACAAHGGALGPSAQRRDCGDCGDHFQRLFYRVPPAWIRSKEIRHRIDDDSTAVAAAWSDIRISCRIDL